MEKGTEKTCIYELHRDIHPHFYITGTSFPCQTRNFHWEQLPLFFSKEKIPNDGWVDLESEDLKLGIPGHFTASSSQALILKKARKNEPGQLGQNPELRLMTFDESVARGRYPHLPKKLTYQSYLPGRALQTQQGLTRLHTPEGVSGAKCSFWGGCSFFSFKKYKDFTRTRGKYRGLGWPVRSLKQIDTLATYHFCMELNKAEASCYCGKLTWLKRTALQTGMLNPWLKSNWRKKRSYYERPKHHRNNGQISFALKEVAQPYNQFFSSSLFLQSGKLT